MKLAAIEERAEYVAGLRALASLLEANPELDVPYFGCGIISAHSAADFKSITQGYGGRWDKQDSGDDYQLSTDFHGIHLIVYGKHADVCERVVTGTRHVPEQRLPEEHIPERIIPAHDEEIVKWVCPEIIGNGKTESSPMPDYTAHDREVLNIPSKYAPEE